MVVELGLDADVVQRHRHVGPQVLVVVHRRGGEVALLGAGLVPEVRALVGAGVPLPLDGVDAVHAPVGRGLEAHVVEDEELGLGTEVGGVGHARGEEVLLRLLGDVARVAAVALAGDRVGDVAVHHERLPAPERVEVGGGGIGHQHHVRLLDLLEAAHGRAVEGVTVLELALVEHGGRDRDVLHHPRQVAEAQVDELDALRLDQLQHLMRGSLFHGADRSRGVRRAGRPTLHRVDDAAIEQAVRRAAEATGIDHEIVPCDPALADTVAFCDAYGYAMEDSANCVVVIGKAESAPVFAACVVLATTRLDVNGVVRRRLGTRKASFAPADDVVRRDRHGHRWGHPARAPRRAAALGRRRRHGAGAHRARAPAAATPRSSRRRRSSARWAPRSSTDLAKPA